MTTRGQARFVRAQVVWMLAVAYTLALLGALSMQLFFAASFLGFLVLVELTAPVNVAPRWRRRLKWVLLLGVVVTVYFVSRRVLEILPEGAF
ncbi:hypothetical protein [Haladaptatus sp. NG-SE-30]